MQFSGMNRQEERKYFEMLDKKNRNRKKSARCIYTGCERYSIGSHSISKNSHIKNIAENGEVMSFCPIRQGDNKELLLKKVGINQASVFHGFCKEHDQLFQSIDINGICTYKDLFLQCYRSVCYWLHMLTVDGSTMGELQKYTDDVMRGFFKRIVPSFDYDAVRFDKEYGENKVDFVKTIKELKTLLETQIECINNDRKIDNSVLVQIGDVEILFRKVEEVIPVVLNTMNTIVTGEDNVFQIVLPNKMDTDIIVINASHKRVVLLDTWKVATSNMLNIIELIESWMISNEIWYIQPSVIEKIPETRLKIICEDIRYWQGEHKLWEVYDMSIFDDLRQKYFKIYKDNDNLDDEYVKKERQKFIPQKRLNKEQREKNMRRLMGKLQYYGDFRDMTKE